MHKDLLTLPADTPATALWKELWTKGLDFEYPLAGQTAAEWLEGLNLTSSQLKLIYHTAREGTANE